MRCHHSLRLSFHLLCPEIWDSFHYHQFRCRTIIKADGDYYCLSQNVFMIIYFSFMFHYLIPNLNLQHLFFSFCHDFMHVENLKILEMTGNKQFTGCPWNIYISLSFSICSKSHKQVLVFILAFHNNTLPSLGHSTRPEYWLSPLCSPDVGSPGQRLSVPGSYDLGIWRMVHNVSSSLCVNIIVKCKNAKRDIYFSCKKYSKFWIITHFLSKNYFTFKM